MTELVFKSLEFFLINVYFGELRIRMKFVCMIFTDPMARASAETLMQNYPILISVPISLASITRIPMQTLVFIPMHIVSAPVETPRY